MVHHGGFDARQLGIASAGQGVFRRHVRRIDRRRAPQPPHHGVLQHHGERARNRQTDRFHFIAGANTGGQSRLNLKPRRGVFDICAAARIHQGQRAANAHAVPLLGRVSQQIDDARFGNILRVRGPRLKDGDVSPTRHQQYNTDQLAPVVEARGANPLQAHPRIQQAVGREAVVGHVRHECVHPLDHGELERVARLPNRRYVAFGLREVAVLAPREKRVEARRAGRWHLPGADSADIAANHDGSKVSGSRDPGYLHLVPGRKPGMVRAVVVQEDSTG